MLDAKASLEESLTSGLCGLQCVSKNLYLISQIFCIISNDLLGLVLIESIILFFHCNTKKQYFQYVPSGSLRANIGYLYNFIRRLLLQLQKCIAMN